MILRPFIENHSKVQTTKFPKTEVQCFKCRCCHAAEARLAFLKTFLGRLQNTSNACKTLSNRSDKVSPWDNTDEIILPKILQATYWEIRKLMERVSLKRTVQFIEGHGGLNPIGNTGGKRMECFDQVISIPGSSLPSCGQPSLLQLLGRFLCRRQNKAKHISALPCASFRGLGIATANPRSSHAQSPAKQWPSLGSCTAAAVWESRWLVLLLPGGGKSRSKETHLCLGRGMHSDQAVPVHSQRKAAYYQPIFCPAALHSVIYSEPAWIRLLRKGLSWF